MNGAGTALAILVVAGVANASFTIPMKFARKWAWENTWLAWALFALVAFPLALGWAVLPHLGKIYNSAAPELLLEVCGFGVGWGVAQVFFGVAVEMIGVALTFSIVLGTSAAMGSLIPMITLHHDRIWSGAGIAIWIAVACVISGVLACAKAGRMREQATAADSRSRSRASLGLALAILCGLGASLMNLGIAFGRPLLTLAQGFGARPMSATIAVWLPLLLAGALPNVLYCVWLMKKNRSAPRYAEAGSNWLLAMGMAVLWLGSTLLYGVSAVELGAWGPILGWPLFMSLIVVTATILGFLTGEWRGSGTRPVKVQWAGVALLIVAVTILAESSRFLR